MRQRFASFFSSISVFVHSVRFRMALWFALILAVVLLVFSVFVYYRTAQQVREQTAARLEVRLRDLNTALTRNYRMRNLDNWLRLPGQRFSSNSFILQSGEVIIVSDADGAVSGLWGSMEMVEAEELAKKVSSYSLENASGKFFSFPVGEAAGSGENPVDYMFTPTPILYENRFLAWTILGYPIDPEGQLPRLFWTLAIAGSFTLLAALAGGYWLADRMLWPVKAITRTAKEISGTDLTRRLNINTRDELGELAGTFDQMLDRLQSAFNRQRQFTADASHELRTPLTIIGLEASRVLASGRSTEDYQRALQVIQSENEFMTRLVSELLTLARMDAGQVKLNLEPVDLSDLALEVTERYEQIAARKGIRLQTGSLPELPIQGDRQYLVQMISNLVDNAIKYSPTGREQWVKVETGQNPNGGKPFAWVRVSDNGTGISDEHLPHLFDRFYRADKARSHNPDETGSAEDIPGSGLGLSIVQWVATVHGGQVTVHSQPGEGSSFEVQLAL